MSLQNRVSVHGVKSLGGHFACLCREFDFYEVKKNNIFQKEEGNTFTFLIIFCSGLVFDFAKENLFILAVPNRHLYTLLLSKEE